MPQTSSGPYESSKSASEIISGMLTDVDTETIPISRLFSSMAHRSFGGIIILLSIIGLLPGISIVAGIAIFVLAAQMTLGYATPKLPRFIVQRHISVAKLRALVRKPIVHMARVEKFINPRWPVLTSPAALRIMGIIVAFLSLVMITPLPLSNLLPAIALIFLSLGFLEKDGLMIVCGLFASIFAMTVGTLMIGVIYQAIMQLLR